MIHSFDENRKKFLVSYNNLELEFELYTIDYIYSVLLEQNDTFESVFKSTIPLKNIRSFLKQLCNDSIGEKYHFFSYIKFFEYEGKKYGLVGGKTNYHSPDISFDYLSERDNRIARTFLMDNNLKWAREIIIVNHKPFLERNKDNYQAIFIERYLQRKFNLFDS